MAPTVQKLCGELARPDSSTRNANATRSDEGWVSARDKLHGRVVGRRPVVEMAPEVIAIRWLTDEGGAQTRVASKRVRDLQSQEPVNTSATRS